MEIFYDVTISCLPREIMVNIFQYLNYTELKQVVLVCQHWRELGEDPFLWRKFCLDPVKVFQETAKVFEEDFTYEGQFQCNSGEFSKLLNIPRLAMLEHLEINPKSVRKLKEEIFVSILNSNLSSLYVGYKTQLLNILPGTIANVINSLKNVTLKAKLTNNQLEQFFDVSKTTNLETLELYHNNLSKVKSPHLSELFSNLKQLTLSFVEVTTSQAEEIFTKISQLSRLESLHMNNVNLSKVDPDVLAKSLGNLKKLSLQNALLHRKQVKQLLVRLGEGNWLTLLDLSGNDLSFASSNMLASVVIRVEKAGLRDTNLNIEQIQELFERVHENCPLKHLAVSDNKDLDRVYNELKQKVGKLLTSVDF